MPIDLPDWTSAIARPSIQATGSPWAYAATSQTRNFTLQSDAHALGILLPDYQTVTVLEITGHVSTVTYLNVDLATANFQPATWVPVMAAIDTSVDIRIDATFASTAYITQVFDVSAPVITPQLPPPWTNPNSTPTAISFSNPGAAATVTILPSPGPGMSIYLHSMQWLWTAASTTADGQWQDSFGTSRVADSPVTAGVPRYVDFKGAALPPDSGWQWLQNGAAAAGSTTCYGTVTYSIF